MQSSNDPESVTKPSTSSTVEPVVDASPSDLTSDFIERIRNAGDNVLETARLIISAIWFELGRRLERRQAEPDEVRRALKRVESEIQSWLPDLLAGRLHAALKKEDAALRGALILAALVRQKPEKSQPSTDDWDKILNTIVRLRNHWTRPPTLDADAAIDRLLVRVDQQQRNPQSILADRHLAFSEAFVADVSKSEAAGRGLLLSLFGPWGVVITAFITVGLIVQSLLLSEIYVPMGSNSAPIKQQSIVSPKAG